MNSVLSVKIMPHRVRVFLSPSLLGSEVGLQDPPLSLDQISLSDLSLPPPSHLLFFPPAGLQSALPLLLANVAL